MHITENAPDTISAFPTMPLVITCQHSMIINKDKQISIGLKIDKISHLGSLLIANGNKSMNVKIPYFKCSLAIKLVFLYFSAQINNIRSKQVYTTKDEILSK